IQRTYSDRRCPHDAMPLLHRSSHKKGEAGGGFQRRRRRGHSSGCSSTVKRRRRTRHNLYEILRSGLSPMNKQDIQHLYSYNKWANDLVLKSLLPLTADQFTKHLGGSFPSVRDTLVHVISADWIWLRRWKADSPRGFFDPVEFPNLDTVQ